MGLRPGSGQEGGTVAAFVPCFAMLACSAVELERAHVAAVLKYHSRGRV